MSKTKRHQTIKDIIMENYISTQEELRDILDERGVTVTQATLSRDLREIGLIKLRDKSGQPYYALGNLQTEIFMKTISQYVTKVARAGFMLVLHTALGEADVLANVIDNEGHETILGTVAGADTLLVICQDEKIAAKLEQDLKQLLLYGES